MNLGQRDVSAKWDYKNLKMYKFYSGKYSYADSIFKYP